MTNDKSENTGWTSGGDWVPPGGDWAPPAGNAPDANPRWQPAEEAPPAPQPGVVPLRPLAFSEILDGGFTTIQRYPKILLGLSTVVYVVVTAIDVAVSAWLGFNRTLESFFGGATQTVGVTTLLQFLLIVGPIQLVASAVLSGLITVTVARGVLGEPVTIGAVWSHAKGRLLRLLAITFVIGAVVIASILGFALVVGFLAATSPVLAGVVGLLGGIAFAFFLVVILVRWSVATPAVMLEVRPGGGRVGPIAAMRRSWRLIKGRTPRTFAIVFVAGLIATVVSSILQWLFGLIAGLLSHSVVVESIGSVGGGVLLMAFIAAVNVLVYTDARMRSEGLDIELAAMRSAESAGSSGSAGPAGSGLAGSDSAGTEPPGSESPWTVR